MNFSLLVNILKSLDDERRGRRKGCKERLRMGSARLQTRTSTDDVFNLASNTIDLQPQVPDSSSILKLSLFFNMKNINFIFLITIIGINFFYIN